MGGGLLISTNLSTEVLGHFKKPSRFCPGLSCYPKKTPANGSALLVGIEGC